MTFPFIFKTAEGGTRAVRWIRYAPDMYDEVEACAAAIANREKAEVDVYEGRYDSAGVIVGADRAGMRVRPQVAS